MFKKLFKKKDSKAEKSKIEEKKPKNPIKKPQQPIEKLKPIKESEVKEKTLPSKLLTAEGWLRRLK